MVLENFELQSGVELLSRGHNWDLHNFADFVGFSFDARARELRLTWIVPSVANPWGDPTNGAPGCVLRFRNVRSLEVHPRDAAVPFSEDLTVEEIARVIPGLTADGEYVHASPDEDFALRFDFQSGAWIEIVAERADLLASEAT